MFLDANTIVRGLLFEGNESDVLALGAIGVIDLVTTAYVFAEVEEVLRRSEFQLEEQEVLELVRYAHGAIAVLPNPPAAQIRGYEGRIRDKKDAPIWAGTDATGAKYLLTGDKDLLGTVPQAIRSKALLAKVFTGEL